LYARYPACLRRSPDGRYPPKAGLYRDALWADPH
jgi:hypothetical protein